MNGLRGILRRSKLLTLSIAIAVLGLAYMVGWLTSAHSLFPNKLIRKVDSLAVRLIRPPAPKPEVRHVETIFLNLDIREVEVPVASEGYGGGMTAFGDELLVLTHDGDIFFVRPGKAERIPVETPDNGLADYIRAAGSDRYAGFTLDTTRLKFNDILYFSDAGEQGLVISYTEWFPDSECYGTTIAKMTIPDGVTSALQLNAGPGDWTVLHRTTPCLPLKQQSLAIEGHMAGGRLAYRSPGKVILGSGDYAWDGIYAPEAYAQVSGNDYGKVLEIDLRDGATREVSKGHRNMQGVLVDSANRIWVTEHGPRGGDELNLIVEGANYGWPEETLGTRYNRLPSPGSGQYGRHDKYARPVYAWVPSLGLCHLTQINDFDASWDGDILVTSLKGRKLFRVRIQNDAVVFAEPIEIGERIRYVQQTGPGKIALWTDAGKVLFVSKAEESFTRVRIDEMVGEYTDDTELQAALATTINACAECHSFEINAPGAAPSLGMVYQRRVGSSDFTGYSPALRSVSSSWTRSELRRFLDDPQSYAPGTSMPDPGINDERVRDGVIEILRRLKEEAE